LDDVLIDVSGVTVTHSSSASDAVHSLTISASDAALDLSSGSLAVATPSSISGNLTIGGGTLGTESTLTVSGATEWSSGTITGPGTVTCEGMLTLLGTGDQGHPAFENLAGATLDNAGTASVAVGSVLYLSDGSVFYNQSSGRFTVETSPGSEVTPISSDGTGTAFINEGTFVDATNSILDVAVAFNQVATGSTEVQAGYLSLLNGGSILGAVVVDSGATADFAGPFALGSSSSVSGAGSVAFGRYFIANTNVTIDGSYDVAGGTADTYGSATFAQSATIHDLGSDLDVYAATLDLDTAQSFSFATVTVTAGSSVDGGGGDLTVTDSMTWDNGLIAGFGTLTISSPATLSLDGPESLDGVALDNHGTATWSGGTISAADGAVFNNEPGATFDAQSDDTFGWNQTGAVPIFNNLAGATFIKSGGTGPSGTYMGLVFNNNGTVILPSGTLKLGGSFPGGQPVTNAGNVSIGPGATLVAYGDYDQMVGSTSLSSGTFFGGNLNVQGGSLAGSGIINANVTNGGQVIPGGTGATGTLTINGNYTQTATGALDIDLGGTTAGSQYGQLAVSRAATLGGTLNVATIGGFTPAFGNTFQVLTFGSLSGNFATYNAPSLASSLYLDAVFSPSGDPTSLSLDIDRVAISGAPAFPLEGIPINLTATVSSPSAGHSFNFSWTVTQNGNPFGSGAGSTFSFTPDLNAAYLVSLTVTDAAGATGTTSLQLIVAPSIFVVNPSASGALTVSGNASINVPGEIVVDSSSTSALSAAGNAQITASAIDVQGGFQKTGNATISPAPTTGVSVADPLGTLTTPSPTSLTNYGSLSFTSGTHTLCPGIYSQIKVSGNASLTLSAGSGGSPGTYIIKGGGLTVTGGASLSGQDVFIYNAGSNYPGSGAISAGSRSVVAGHSPSPLRPPGPMRGS
jgi:hypothetical protein